MIQPTREEIDACLSDWSRSGWSYLYMNYAAYWNRCLEWFHELLGKPRRLWWEEYAEAEDERWTSCVRAAIVMLADEAGLSPAMVATWLDLPEFPRARQRVIATAREMLHARA